MRAIIAAVFLVSLGGCAHVATVAAPVAAKLTGAVDGVAILAPPPAPGSPRAKLEEGPPEQVWSEARLAQARADNEIDAFKAFAPAMGPGFTADKYPATKALFEKTIRALGPNIGVTKDHWKRPRPFIVDPTRATCITPDDRLRASGSYPSGHSAIGWGWALVLAEATPDKASAILQRGREYGDSRVVCGVHYPSDVEAGRVLAAAEIARLHAEPGFQDAMRTAAAELAK
ncbi:MAG: phosphatase PAP2 family protein [Alphaproteobacteria bacterium]|nr:phosphatase PAP2 family protein [Alphaproteobacteria bacterium]